jgi:hypothetical protein
VPSIAIARCYCHVAVSLGSMRVPWSGPPPHSQGWQGLGT